MGNGSSVPGGLDPNTFECDAQFHKNGDDDGDEIDVGEENEVYFCCLSQGNVYRSSPDPDDKANDVPAAKFKEPVRAVARRGTRWIKVAAERWLPLTFFWGPRPKDGQVVEIMRRYGTGKELGQDRKASKAVSPVTNKEYSENWSVMDDAVSSVKRNDAVDKAADALEELRLRAVKKIQAAERGRQQRKKRKKKSKKHKHRHKKKGGHESKQSTGSIGWDVMNKTVHDVKLHDVIDVAAGHFEALREKAALRLQSAERGRQARKQRKKERRLQKKLKHERELREKEEQIAKLKAKLDKKDKKKKKKTTMTDEELKQREQEKEAQLREALAKKNALGHKTLPSLNESETKNNHHDSTTDA
eukprot:INCI15751.1.p1 GENE.INCI15751.1~~INCI15751.1.p1  ORF type:complete len:359 (+),score=96.20 INCI15751.1:254-1330(+)